MAIIAPTIDEFDEPTVMLIIRNLVKWIQTDLVPQINDNDIVSATQTSDGLSFEINLVKGDGSTIPVGKITLEDEDNIKSGSFQFDDETRMLSGTLLKEDGTPINIPAVKIPGGSGTQVDYGIDTIQFTYEGNNLSCVITQNDGTQTTSNTVVIAGGGGTGGNPYPTAISGTVGEDGNITLKMTMSEGNPVTATIDMSYFASAEDLEDIQTQLTAIKITTTVSQESSNVIKVSNAVNGNSADFTMDISVVDGELILTAEDGVNQAITKQLISIGGINKTEYGIVPEVINFGTITFGEDSVMNVESSPSPADFEYITNVEATTQYTKLGIKDDKFELFNVMVPGENVSKPITNYLTDANATNMDKISINLIDDFYLLKVKEGSFNTNISPLIRLPSGQTIAVANNYVGGYDIYTATQESVILNGVEYYEFHFVKNESAIIEIASLSANGEGSYENLTIPANTYNIVGFRGPSGNGSYLLTKNKPTFIEPNMEYTFTPDLE